MKSLIEFIKNKSHLRNIEYDNKLFEQLRNIQFVTHGNLRSKGRDDYRYHQSDNLGGITNKNINETFDIIDNKLIEYLWNNKIKLGKEGTQFGVIKQTSKKESFYILFNILFFDKDTEEYDINIFDCNRFSKICTINNVCLGFYIDLRNSLKFKENINNKHWPEVIIKNSNIKLNFE